MVTFLIVTTLVSIILPFPKERFYHLTMDCASAQYQNSARTLLKSEFAQRKQRNASYSLRAFARDLGLSHTYLSLIFHGKRNISPTVLSKFLEEDVEVFSKCVRNKTSSYHYADLDHFSLISEWYHIAILELSSLDDFRATPKWIAKKLGLNLHEAQLALDRLKRLGHLVKSTKQKWKKAQKKLFFEPGTPNKYIRKFHRQMILKALDVLDSNQPIECRDITSVTLTGDPKRIAGAKKKIEKFRKELSRYMANGDGDGDGDRIYQLNVQLFPLCDVWPSNGENL